MPQSTKDLIIEYIETHDESKINESRKEIIQGNPVVIQAYRLPTELVFFNPNNGRFKKEFTNLKKKLGGDINPEDPEDAKKIQKLLLTLGNPDGNFSADTIRTMNNLAAYGQTDPGLITPDGYLIDGNRRLAVIRQLYDDTNEEKYRYINVARLETAIDDKDAYAIEATISLGMDPKVKYSPLNELLKLEEGIRLGHSEAHIAKLLYGDISEDEIKEKLARLDLVKEYVDYFFSDPENIELAEGKHEHFIELQKILHLADENGKTISEITQIQLACFNLIYYGVSSDRIRAIKSAITNDYELNTLYKIAGFSKSLISSEPSDDEEIDKKNNPVETEYKNFEDEIDSQKNEDKPGILLTHILNKFKVLKFDEIDFSNPEIKSTSLFILEYLKKLEEKSE